MKTLKLLPTAIFFIFILLESVAGQSLPLRFGKERILSDGSSEIELEVTKTTETTEIIIDQEDLYDVKKSDNVLFEEIEEIGDGKIRYKAITGTLAEPYCTGIPANFADESGNEPPETDYSKYILEPSGGACSSYGLMYCTSVDRNGECEPDAWTNRSGPWSDGDERSYTIHEIEKGRVCRGWSFEGECLEWEGDTVKDIEGNFADSETDFGTVDPTNAINNLANTVANNDTAKDATSSSASATNAATSSRSALVKAGSIVGGTVVVTAGGYLLVKSLSEDDNSSSGGSGSGGGAVNPCKAGIDAGVASIRHQYARGVREPNIDTLEPDDYYTERELIRITLQDYISNNEYCASEVKQYLADNGYSLSNRTINLPISWSDKIITSTYSVQPSYNSNDNTTSVLIRWYDEVYSTTYSLVPTFNRKLFSLEGKFSRTIFYRNDFSTYGFDLMTYSPKRLRIRGDYSYTWLHTDSTSTLSLNQIYNRLQESFENYSIRVDYNYTWLHPHSTSTISLNQIFTRKLYSQDSFRARADYSYRW